MWNTEKLEFSSSPTPRVAFILLSTLFPSLWSSEDNTALSVFCIIVARLHCQPVAHHRVSGYCCFVFHPFPLLTSKREKTRDTKFMPRVIFHNKGKKGGAMLMYSWEETSRWHDCRRDGCSSLGSCANINTSNTKMTTGSDSIEFKVNNKQTGYCTW